MGTVNAVRSEISGAVLDKVAGGEIEAVFTAVTHKGAGLLQEKNPELTYGEAVALATLGTIATISAGSSLASKIGPILKKWDFKHVKKPAGVNVYETHAGDVSTSTTTTKMETGIFKAGTDAGGGFKHHADIDENLLNREIKLPDAQVQAKFPRHAEQFGVQGNWNKQNGELFKQKLIEHVANPDTIPIAGTYTRGKVQDVVHYYNPKTELNVMKDKNGEFISGWKLNDGQQKYLKETGKIGGDQ
ncbi:hypothetical protein MIDIC_240075 [Alphaproteobacteria bacterium]